MGYVCVRLRILSVYDGSQWNMEAMAELREKLLNSEESNIKDDMATLSQVGNTSPTRLRALCPQVSFTKNKYPTAIIFWSAIIFFFT